MPHDSRNDTPEEYTRYCGAMSYPSGAAKAAIETQEVDAHQAEDADYVDQFIRQLEDPDVRLVTEKPNDWKSWGGKAKAAILAVLKQAKEAK